jgi:hypothetical protein
MSGRAGNIDVAAQAVAFVVVGLVGTFRPAAKIQRDPACRVEAHGGMRAFVHHPQVVVFVEADTVRIAQSVNPFAEFASQFAGGVEL